MKKAIFVGSFDSIHKGHLSIIKKALKIVDHLVVVVANNPEKISSPLEKRYQIVKAKLATIKATSVEKMETGLIAKLAKKMKINLFVRGARNSDDFNFELMMAIQNKKINKAIETILILPDKANIKIRASILPKS